MVVLVVLPFVEVEVEDNGNGSGRSSIESFLLYGLNVDVAGVTYSSLGDMLSTVVTVIVAVPGDFSFSAGVETSTSTKRCRPFRFGKV